MRSAITLASLALLAASITGCGYPKPGGAPPPLSGADVASAKSRFPDATDASLSSGRDLFLAKCNGCHDYPDLSSVAEGAWPKIMGRMGPNAKLDAAQTDAVLRFVLVARAR